MSTGIGRWLRQQREARGWARREMARRLIQAAEAADDATMPGIEHLCTYIRRWESGRHELTERYKLYYCTAFGIRVGQFGTAPLPKPRTLAQQAESAVSSGSLGAGPVSGVIPLLDLASRSESAAGCGEMGDLRPITPHWDGGWCWPRTTPVATWKKPSSIASARSHMTSCTPI
ncbi:MAG: helix-turn-helix transcriptional regulator [Streptosporangiaceae bacterium]|nr:helix-turn-helix transcriptional regulator [Streptosporangiaceae bacterium]